jgi:hypothetical protein
MNISGKSRQELFKLSRSDILKKDMNTVNRQKHNPFLKNGRVDIDAYIEFVTLYNEFINYKPKPFVPMTDK